MSKFESIYHKHYRQLVGVASKVIDDREEIRDIIQDVFTSYYEKTEIKKQLVLQPYSWLVRATLNKCIDHLERNKKHVNLSQMSEAGQEDEPFDGKKHFRILQEAVARLSPREIKLVVLYSKEFSYKEIAEITGINYASVGKTLSRTLQKLKLILKQMNYEMYQ